MKKAVIAMVLAAVLSLGMGADASASFMDGDISASGVDAAKNPVSVTFAQKDNDVEDNGSKLMEAFWKNEEVKATGNALGTYYGFVNGENTCCSPKGMGTLDLTGSGASAGNPVTVTFTGVDLKYHDPVDGKDWLYVFQMMEDGTCKLHEARKLSENAMSAEFTDGGVSWIWLQEFALARESLDYDTDVADMTTIASAKDAQGNPVTVTAQPLDGDMKAIVNTLGLEELNYEYEIISTAANVNLVGGSVSESNPVTITFAVNGVKAGDRVLVFHKTQSAGWEKLTGTVEEGAVTVTFTSLSPVGIVRAGKKIAGTDSGETGGTGTSGTAGENANAGAAGGTGASGTTGSENAAAKAKSPKTGDLGAPALALGAVCVTFAATVVYVKRKRAF